jgi:hypothetical protein
MDQWQNKFKGMTVDGLIAELTILEKQIPLVRSRAKVIGTQAEKVILGELDAELSRLQKEYINITTSTHPNIVATSLAELQGRQKEVQDIIAMWKYAKEADRTLDTRINFCKTLITERREHEQSRRIGNE